MMQSCFRNTHMLLASNSSRACAPWTFCKIIFIRFEKVGASNKEIRWLCCAGALRETRICLMYAWSVRSRQSVFSLQMLCGVVMPVVWNAVELYMQDMNLTNGRLLLFKMLMRAWLCRLLAHAAGATPCKGFNVLASQNGFMTQN